MIAGPYVGWVPGYQENQRVAFAEDADDVTVEHPRRAFRRFAADLERSGADWLDA